MDGWGDVVLERRFAEDQLDRLPAPAQDLVRLSRFT
jgi:hypothetical protein